jgi:hypothetical protein
MHVSLVMRLTSLGPIRQVPPALAGQGVEVGGLVSVPDHVATPFARTVPAAGAMIASPRLDGASRGGDERGRRGFVARTPPAVGDELMKCVAWWLAWLLLDGRTPARQKTAGTDILWLINTSPSVHIR